MVTEPTFIPKLLDLYNYAFQYGYIHKEPGETDYLRFHVVTDEIDFNCEVVGIKTILYPLDRLGECFGHYITLENLKTRTQIVYSPEGMKILRAWQ